MPVKFACAWCQTFNDCPGTGPIWCRKCCHRADVGKHLCDCLMCQPMLLGVPDLPDPELLPLPAPVDPWDVTSLPYLPLQPIEVGKEEGAVQVDSSTVKRPRVRVTAHPTYVMVQVEDDAHPEFWLNVIVSDCEITRWLQAVVRMADAED